MDYAAVASPDAINRAAEGLAGRHVSATVVDTGAAAFEQIKDWIPAAASVMNGASKTLEAIGFIDYLKDGQHGWNNLHAAILAEQDPGKQAELRRQSVLSDYYLGSVHALAETGEFMIASNTGSQLPHVVFTSPNLIFVVGAQKLVPTLADAFDRLEQYVVPLEDERMKQAYGMGTQLNKIVTFKGENPTSGRTVRLIIVREALGF